MAQEYIQSQDLAHDVYVRPHPIFGLDEGKVITLKKRCTVFPIQEITGRKTSVPM